MDKNMVIKPVIIIPKVWGEEHCICSCEGMVGKIMYLNRNKGCSNHWHRDKREYFHVLEGVMLLCYDEKWMLLNAGDTIEIPRGTPHKFVGLEDVKFIEFAIVCDGTDGHDDNYRIDKSRYYDQYEIDRIMESL